MTLTPGQQRFCQEYLVALNATKAYQAACSRSSVRSARTNGGRLLTNADIAREIDRLMEERAKATGVSMRRTVDELKHVAFADPGDVFDADGSVLPIEQIPEAARRAVASIDLIEEMGPPDAAGNRKVVSRTKKVRFWDKNKGLEAIGKHLGMFAARVHHTAEVQASQPSEAEVAKRVARLLNKAAARKGGKR